MWDSEQYIRGKYCAYKDIIGEKNGLRQCEGFNLMNLTLVAAELLGSGGVQLSVMAAGLKAEGRSPPVPSCQCLWLACWDQFSTSDQKTTHESCHTFHWGKTHYQMFPSYRKIQDFKSSSLEFNTQLIFLTYSNHRIYIMIHGELLFPALLHVASRFICWQPCITCSAWDSKETE